MTSHKYKIMGEKPVDNQITESVYALQTHHVNDGYIINITQPGALYDKWHVIAMHALPYHQNKDPVQ